MVSAMNIFVTGGSGFVGGHFIEEARRQGHRVLAMARSADSAARVRAFGAEPIDCSLSDVSEQHLAGVDAVVHAAAHVKEWGTREELFEANVAGTARLVDAARLAGVRRFVYVGTEAAVFSGSDLPGIDESFPYPARHRYLYSETKAEAERLVLAAASPTFTALSVRPRFVWGPRDASVLPAILRMAEAGTFRWLDGGRKKTSTTHVTNLARALVLAVERGRGGQAYFVADEGTRTLRSFLTELAATRGVALPARSVPSVVLRPLARFVERIFRLVRARSAPPMTSFAIDMLSCEITVDTAKARAELG
jgi:nucleoside-diphosphate-sugar epimerase